MEMTIVRPEKDYFEDKTIKVGGLGFAYSFERVEYTTDKGILAYYKDCALPKHGFPYPEAVLAVNVCKRLMKMFFKFVNPIYAYFNRNKIIGDYLRVADNLLAPHSLKDEYLCPVAKETKKLLTLVLNDLKIDVRLADVIALMLEYDDAYRFYFQDIMSCLEKEELFESNIQLITEEIIYGQPVAFKPNAILRTYLRIEEIIYSRAVNFKPNVILRYFKMLFILMLIPKVRKAFKKALKEIDFEKMKLDQHDHFWILNRSDWKFEGKTWQERHPEWLEANGGKEPQGYQF
jgi:hypothetical protein